MVSPVSREQVIQDLRRVAEELGEVPSLTQYCERGKHSKSSIYRKFDDIGEARKAAGLDSMGQRGGYNRIGRKKLLNAIHTLYEELGRPPRREEMLEQGEYSETPFIRVFGSWGEAVVEAGYEPYRPSSELAERVTQTCEQCGEASEELESQTKEQENWFCSKDCKYKWQAENVVGEAHHQYAKVTVECDWCDAEIERKPAELNLKERFFCDYDWFSEWCSHERVGSRHPRWKGGGDLYYGPNWQSQRRKRLEYDSYECQMCGLSGTESKDEYGRQLEVHHLRPVRTFHEEPGDVDWDVLNGLDNLVTLCLPCHRKIEKLPVQPQFE